MEGWTQKRTWLSISSSQTVIMSVLCQVTLQNIVDCLIPSLSFGHAHNTNEHAFFPVSKNGSFSFCPQIAANSKSSLESVSFSTKRLYSSALFSTLQKKSSRNIDRGIKSYRLQQRTLWVLFTADSK